jgi:polyisoprenoid-binding protein YceI
MMHRAARPLIRALLPAFMLSASAASTAGEAPAFLPVAAQSSLSFTGSQQGEKFTGSFHEFDARVAYAPEQLASSRISATIKMKSLDSKSQDRDSALIGPEWFEVAKFPIASFRTTAIRMTPTGPVGDAELTIKSATKHLAFPFSWKMEGGKAVLDARVTLDRLDFGVGTGEWADEGIAGRKVEVSVHLVLAAAPNAAPPTGAANGAIPPKH